MNKSDVRKIIKQELLKEAAKDTKKLEIASVINKFLIDNGFKSIGMRVKPTDLGEKYKTVKILDIKPEHLPNGFGLVFKKIKAIVKVGLDSNGNGYIMIEYSWEHPRGSNGYTVIWRYKSGKWEDIS